MHSTNSFALIYIGVTYVKTLKTGCLCYKDFVRGPVTETLPDDQVRDLHDGTGLVEGRQRRRAGVGRRADPLDEGQHMLVDVGQDAVGG